MNLWLRLAWAMLSWRRRSPLLLSAVGRRRFRVWPSDLDVFNHMNNGTFLSLLDLGRLDLMLRSGTWQAMKKNNWYPVIVASTITYRKSLRPWQTFDLETKIIGWDDISYFIEQRFVVGEEIYAKAILRGRFLAKPRGILTPQEAIDACGGWPGLRPTLPEWVKDWAETTALPKGKEPAPSNWDE